MSKTINLDEKLECKGYWWLPNNPNETVAGVVTYMPDEKILLELIGAFDLRKTLSTHFLMKTLKILFMD